MRTILPTFPMIAVAVVLAILPFMLPAQVEAKTILTFGYYLTEDCDAFLAADKAHGPLNEEGARCYGYIKGIAEALQAEGDHPVVTEYLPKACIADDAGTYELVVAVANFLDSNPELRISRTGYSLVRQAFADKFPCK
ncbi:Rap1a/Tai family immunity protein [Rhizobium sp. RAF56]|uniref:Rap1a/Tai family immunity protein n=1 Tax=Rhizobium sp. RAF56 TaxID=3233062 RepID=UPI003F9AAF37